MNWVFTSNAGQIFNGRGVVILYPETFVNFACMFELKSLTRKSNSENDILETGIFVQDTRPVWCWLKKTLLALDKYVVHLSLVFEIPFN